MNGCSLVTWTPLDICIWSRNSGSFWTVASSFNLCSESFRTVFHSERHRHENSSHSLSCHYRSWIGCSPTGTRDFHSNWTYNVSGYLSLNHIGVQDDPSLSEKTRNCLGETRISDRHGYVEKTLSMFSLDTSRWLYSRERCQLEQCQRYRQRNILDIVGFDVVVE